jgi:hypothetical protein
MSELVAGRQEDRLRASAGGNAPARHLHRQCGRERPLPGDEHARCRGDARRLGHSLAYAVTLQARGRCMAAPGAHTETCSSAARARACSRSTRQPRLKGPGGCTDAIRLPIKRRLPQTGVAAAFGCERTKRPVDERRPSRAQTARRETSKRRPPAANGPQDRRSAPAAVAFWRKRDKVRAD